jgi:hypothetical protein
MPRFRDEERQTHAPQEVRHDVCGTTARANCWASPHARGAKKANVCARYSVIPGLKIVYPPNSPSSSIARQASANHSPMVSLRPLRG